MIEPENDHKNRMATNLIKGRGAPRALTLGILARGRILEKNPFIVVFAQ